MKIKIISGFLGAGKTTFINKYILDKQEKIVIIENEFGEIGIDKDLIQKDIPIKEINSGCICCSLAVDFREKITEIIKTFLPNIIIIEPSGIAQLSETLRIFNFFTKEYDVEVEDKIVLVDVYNFNEYLDGFGSFYTDQIENANIIFLSNIDKLNDKELEKNIKEIEKINSNCIIFKSDWREIDNDILEEILIEARKNNKLNIDIENENNKLDISVNDTSNINKNEKNIKWEKIKNRLESFSINKIRQFTENDIKDLGEKILSGYFGKIIRGKGIISFDNSFNKSEKNNYWNFNSNISCFEYKQIYKEIKSENIILIGYNLRKDNIYSYFK